VKGGDQRREVPPEEEPVGKTRSKWFVHMHDVEAIRTKRPHGSEDGRNRECDRSDRSVGRQGDRVPGGDQIDSGRCISGIVERSEHHGLMVRRGP
jgi:hypothetical protein